MKGLSKADPEGYEAEQKQRNITPGTKRILTGIGYASKEKRVCKARCNAKITPKDEGIHKRLFWYAPGHLPRSAFEVVGICAHYRSSISAAS